MTTLSATRTLPPLRTMLAAWTHKDPRFDGVFFVAVKTTSVFCRPVCRAKPARPQNIEFFATAQDAMYHGYRPCKLCRPVDSGSSPPPIVQKLLRLVEQSPQTKFRERELRELGINPSTARRQFRANTRMTFAAYQRARRMGVAFRGVRSTGSATQAQLDAGFESASGFRQAFARLFGSRPSDASSVSLLTSRWIRTPLGPMLAVASDHGVVLFDFADRRSIERAILSLRRRRRAVIVPGHNGHLEQLAHEIDEYFRGERTHFDVKLAPVGSAFQRRCWDYLRSIEYGSTRSYAQQAVAIGRDNAVRAVASANGMNYIAIIIPCHRVIGSDGSLTGYGGGLARKRWLLEHERNHSSTAARIARSSETARPARKSLTPANTASLSSSARFQFEPAKARSSRP